MFSNECKKKVKEVIEGVVSRTISTHSGVVKGQHRPFRDRLANKDIWRVARFERSFSTSMGGSGGFEKIAKILAIEAGHTAINQYQQRGLIYDAQATVIRTIIEDYRANTRKPNWSVEKALIDAAQHGSRLTEVRINSDLYILKQDGSKYFYSMKAPKANIDQAQIAKTDCFNLYALNNSFHPRFSMAYNPWGAYRTDYSWSVVSKIFSLQHDPIFVIGKEFWDEVASPGAYENLLELFDEVGAEMKDEIESFFGID